MVGYESLGRLFGRKIVRRLGAALDSAGINIDAETFLGMSVVVTVILSVVIALVALSSNFIMNYIVLILSKISPEVYYTGTASPVYLTLEVGFTYILSFIVSAVTVAFLIYVVILLRIDARRKAIEAVLPDFLLLASANVRAGMTVDQALWYAAKPEFGLLSSEVEMVAKRSFAGEPFDKALDRLGRRFDSRILKRAIALIKQGIASGGKLADILERVAEDARDMQMMKKEISASLLMYVIFIMFAAAFATPFLFSVAHQLLIRLETVISQVPNLSTSTLQKYGAASRFGFVKIGKLPIHSDDFMLFSVITLVFTVFMSSMIIGIIRYGSKKEGLKLFPLLLVVAVVVFILTESALSTVLKMLS
ncbi:type II secretion system F family protein [Candidatus Micrarchaeota archaeon]|nr:type II secretion system F family protein [Candidatus Micrarchaeota archaeon]